jgi:hypothetical protein
MTPTDPIGMSGTDGRRRLERILAIMTPDDEGDEARRRLCPAAAEALQCEGAGVMVMADGVPAPLCASGSTAAGLEEWQRALGEGPNVDAYALNRPVAEPDLAAGPWALGPELEVLVDAGAEVHQASGVVSVQLEVSVGEALVRLRAHAFATGHPLSEVAAAVVAHRLRLDE